MNPPFSEKQLAVVQRNRFLLPLAFGLILCAPLLPFLVGGSEYAGLVAFIPFLLMGGVLGGLMAVFRNPLTTDEPRRISANIAGVFIDGKLTLPREKIRAGFVVPDAPERPKVRLERARRLPFEIRVENEDEGRALLSALGLDASQSVATFRLPSRVFTERRFAVVMGIVFALFVLIALGVRAVGNLMVFVQPLLALSILGFSIFTRTRLSVGADGILIAWLWNRRFIPYSELDLVTLYIDQHKWRRNRWQGIELRLDSGEEVRIPVTGTNSLDKSRSDLILERIRQAQKTYREGRVIREAAQLVRGRRPVAAWIQALRAMGTGAASDHRNAPMPSEELWRIALDPGAAAEARTGAAIALGPTLTPDGRRRLLSAARATAAPKLRIALEAAARTDDEALREALAEMEAEEEKERRRSG